MTIRKAMAAAVTPTRVIAVLVMTAAMLALHILGSPWTQTVRAWETAAIVGWILGAVTAPARHRLIARLAATFRDVQRP